MPKPLFTPEEHYATLVTTLLSHADVTHASDGPPTKGFGANALKVRGKIFAMLVRSQLVVKLPKARVDALIAAEKGERFAPRHDGRLMKEWFVLAPAFTEEWLPLAHEALDFAGDLP